jgi:hypothetical protein
VYKITEKIKVKNFDNCEDIKNLFPKIYSEIKIEDEIEWEKRRKKDLEYYEKNKGKYSYLDEEYKKNLENRKYEGPSKWTIVYKITEKIKVKKFDNSFFNY